MTNNKDTNAGTIIQKQYSLIWCFDDVKLWFFDYSFDCFIIIYYYLVYQYEPQPVQSLPLVLLWVDIIFTLNLYGSISICQVSPLTLNASPSVYS